MNGYERFMKTLQHKEPDRIPIWELIINEPTLSAWGADSIESFVTKESLDGITIFEDVPLRALDTDEIRENYPHLSHLSKAQNCELSVDDWGIVWGKTEFNIFYPVTGPIHSKDILNRYTPPEPDQHDRLQTLRSAVKKFKGEKAIVFLTHDAFEFSHYLRGGMDNLFMDYITNPTVVHELAEIVIDYKIKLMELAVKIGADVVVSGDDYAGRKGPLMSPRHFQEFILPYLKRSIAAAHKMGVPYVKHTDGNIWMILDMIVDAGIDAIDPLEPIAGMDIGEVKQKYGDRITIIGNIDCTNLLPHGDTKDIEKAVKETIAKAAPGGGYILASSNSIHPSVKPDNYKTMVETALRFGTYPIDKKLVKIYKHKNYIKNWMNNEL